MRSRLVTRMRGVGLLGVVLLAVPLVPNQRSDFSLPTLPNRRTSSTSTPRPTSFRHCPALAMPTQKKSSRSVRINGKVSWCRSRFFRERPSTDQVQDCGETEVIQDSGSEIFAIETFPCTVNVVGVLLIYGIK